MDQNYVKENILFFDGEIKCVILENKEKKHDDSTKKFEKYTQIIVTNSQKDNRQIQPNNVVDDVSSPNGKVSRDYSKDKNTNIEKLNNKEHDESKDKNSNKEKLNNKEHDDSKDKNSKNGKFIDKKHGMQISVGNVNVSGLGMENPSNNANDSGHVSKDKNSSNA